MEQYDFIDYIQLQLISTLVSENMNTVKCTLTCTERLLYMQVLHALIILIMNLFCLLTSSRMSIRLEFRYICLLLFITDKHMMTYMFVIGLIFRRFLSFDINE
ncbi:hypothetical protein BDB01DRAFT_839246 [Pilobolus umbonatus]|nr:hypothetical protein BDB01DRAFT_839246 [Pilobolus umbonatus]